MKMLRIPLALLLSACVGMLSAQSLTVKQEKEKFGYADDAGKMVIKAEYTKAYPFDNSGRAKVSKGEKWGFIDKDGKPVIKIEYDEIGEFKNGIALVKKNKKYGYINYDGTDYIKPDYNFIGTPNEQGWTWVGKGKTLESAQLGLYHNDKLIIKPTLCYLGFYVNTDSIDYRLGDPVPTVSGIPANFEIKQNLSKISETTEPYIWLSLSGMTRLFDLDGNPVIKVQKGAMGMPRDGYSIVRSWNSKKNTYSYNYVSADGKSTKLFKKPIVQILDSVGSYESCRPFSNGFAQCGTEKETYIIDTTGKTHSAVYNHLTPVKGHGFISMTDGKYGLIAPNGDEILPLVYGSILEPFKDSDIMPASDGTSGKFGFISFKGNTVVPFRFDDAISFFDGKGYVKENGKYGVVDINGNYIVQNRWGAMKPAEVAGCDYIWVKADDNANWQCLKMSGDSISFNNTFEDVFAFDSKNRALFKQGEMYGAVNATGAIVLPVRLSSAEIAALAIKTIDGSGKERMSDIEAYRFNVYNNKDRHKLELKKPVAVEMWDF